MKTGASWASRAIRNRWIGSRRSAGSWSLPAQTAGDDALTFTAGDG